MFEKAQEMYLSIDTLNADYVNTHACITVNTE